MARKLDCGGDEGYGYGGSSTYGTWGPSTYAIYAPYQPRSASPLLFTLRLLKKPAETTAAKKEAATFEDAAKALHA